MNITLTINADNGDQLLTSLTDIAKALVGAGVKPSKKSEAAPTIPASANTTAAEVTEGENITVEQVRAVVQSASQAGKKDGIKATLKEFGIAKVTELKAEQYPEFLEKIKAL